MKQLVVEEQCSRVACRSHYSSCGQAPGQRPKKKTSFYSDEDDEEDLDYDYAGPAELDPDHRLLLRAAQPLLNSRNAGVRSCN